MKLPKISIITPSYNQCEFLEETIESVIKQDYPNLEYIVIDGGSNDGSVDIIKKYEDFIDYWVSEPDNGQSHAINKGLKVATGEWVGWQNSDDIYYPSALITVAKTVMKNPSVDLIVGDMHLIDSSGKFIRDMHFVKPSFRSLAAEGMVIANQTAFWKRKVHQNIGYLDENLHFCMDLDWFLRLTKSSNGIAVKHTLGALRIHESAKTQKFKHKSRAEKKQVYATHDVEMSSSERQWCKAKRVFQLLARGDFYYVLRGFKRRFSAKLFE